MDNVNEKKHVNDAIKFLEEKYKKEIAEEIYNEKLKKCLEFEDMLAKKFGAIVQYH